MRFLLDGGSVEYTADVIDEWLGPLLEHDRARHGRFVPTLRAYLDADGHHPTAAAACHVHVSTLKYRLGVIRRVLGRPLWDPDVRFGLRVAFRLLDILQPRAKGESARDRRAGGGHPAPVVAGS
jgi:DNA-binding PucR family transcriptional regulator